MHDQQQQIFDQLKRSRYFKDISDEMLRKLLSLSKFVSFKEGTIILRQGEFNEDVYCILKGSVVVEMDDQTLCILQRHGDLFGELSVISGAPCNATVRAYEDLEAVTISAAVLKRIQDDSSHELHLLFYKWFTRILMDKLAMTSEKAKRFEEANKQLQEANQQLEKANQQMDQDLELAADMQRACMSQKIKIPFLKTAIHFYPFSKVSGDMYHIEEAHDGSCLFFLGDGTGHGIAAAFITMMCRMAFSSIETREELHEVMIRLNRLLGSCTPDDKFLTGILLRITSAGKLTMCDAGQGFPLIVPADGSKIVCKKSQSIPLGMFEDTKTYKQEHYALQPGDRVLLYTDGIPEHPARNGEQFGRERIVKFLEEHRHLELEHLLLDLLKTVERFSRGTVHEDDVTLIGLEMK